MLGTIHLCCKIKLYTIHIHIHIQIIKESRKNINVGGWLWHLIAQDNLIGLNIVGVAIISSVNLIG